MKVKKLHYISGVIITIFTGAHLVNHCISVFGIQHHILLMNELRKVYRNPVIELLVLTAVVLQIISGIKLYTRKKKFLNNFYDKLQLWSGLYLAFFFVFHIGAVMMGRIVLDLDTNFYFGAAGLNTFPAILFFIPYYGLAILSFFGHITAIHAQKMKKNIFGVTVRQQSRIIQCIAIITTLIIFYGVTEGFSGVTIPQEYNISMSNE